MIICLLRTSKLVQAEFAAFVHLESDSGTFSDGCTKTKQRKFRMFPVGTRRPIMSIECGQVIEPNRNENKEIASSLSLLSCPDCRLSKPKAVKHIQPLVAG